jgi:cell division protein FtsN
MNSFSTYFKDKDDKNDFYIGIGVIVLFLGCGVFYGLNLFDSQEILASAFESDAKTETYITDENSGFQFENEEDKTFTTVLLKDKNNIKKVDSWLEDNPETLIEKEDNSLSIEQMIDSLEASQKAKTESEIAKIETETEQDTTNKTIAITEQEDSVESLDNTTITSTTEDKSSIEDKIATEEIKVNEPKQPKTQPKTQPKNSDNVSSSRNCIIIVGAFSLSHNADKLKKRLIKKGYPAYTFFRKGNKVVGLKQSCENTEATQKMLKEIQAKYNPSAWLLKSK